MVHRQFSLPERAREEITSFLRHVDWDETREVFDLPRERYLRNTQPDQLFRRTMRVRVHMAREYTSRMAHNVRIVQEWANREIKDAWEKPESALNEKERKLIAVSQTAAEFRVLAAFRNIHLTLWLLFWRFLDPPSIAALRKCGAENEVDLLALYSRFKENCGEAALTYSQRFYEAIISGL